MTPADILNCILVSRSWKTEFYPFLWRTLQTATMALTRSRSRRQPWIDSNSGDDLEPEDNEGRLHGRHRRVYSGGRSGNKDIFCTPQRLCVLQLNCHLIQTLYVTGINTLELLAEGGLCLNLRELYYRADFLPSSTSTSLSFDGDQSTRRENLLGLESVMKMVRLNAHLSLLSIANIYIRETATTATVETTTTAAGEYQVGDDLLESLEALIQLLEEQTSIQIVSLHLREGSIVDFGDEAEDEDDQMEEEEHEQEAVSDDEFFDDADMTDVSNYSRSVLTAIPLNFALDWIVRLMQTKTQLMLTFPCQSGSPLLSSTTATTFQSSIMDRESVLLKELTTGQSQLSSPEDLMTKLWNQSTHIQQQQHQHEQSPQPPSQFLQVRDLDLCLASASDYTGTGASSPLFTQHNSTRVVLQHGVLPAFSSLFKSIPRLRLRIIDSDDSILLGGNSSFQSRFSRAGHWEVEGTLEDKTFADLVRAANDEGPLRHLKVSGSTTFSSPPPSFITGQTTIMAGPWSQMLGPRSLDQLLSQQLQHKTALEYLEICHNNDSIDSDMDSVYFGNGSFSYIPILTSCPNLRELHILGGCWTTKAHDLERHFLDNSSLEPSCRGLRALSISVVNESHPATMMVLDDISMDDDYDDEDTTALTTDSDTLARERAWSGHQVLYDLMTKTFPRLEYLNITTLDRPTVHSSTSCSCSPTPLSSLCHYTSSSLPSSSSTSSLSSLSSYELAHHHQTQDKTTERSCTYTAE
ncbi:hypothetical protein BGZ83_007551 [Gryganskiella cystojenkinii]|nr:hypothetical protein BGZ83_007551 [Gryganskiella cystojenkinii]